MKKQDVELPEELETERKEGGKRKETLMWTEVGLGRRARGRTTSLPPNWGLEHKLGKGLL